MPDIRWRLLLAVTGAACLVGSGITIALVLAEWSPCFAPPPDGRPHFDSRECIRLQTNFRGDAAWILWCAAVAVTLASVVAARVRRGPGIPYLAALVPLAAGFLLIDYLITPTVNGGYSSHDSPPGFGVWTCACVAAAGALLLVFAVILRPVSPGRRDRRVCRAD